jgi:YbbR domain-containing protein
VIKASLEESWDFVKRLAKRLITRNLGMKIFSISVAAVLYLLFIADEELTTSVPASIQFRNTPSDMEISFGVPERVFLEVQGTSRRLSQFAASQTPVILDLSDIPATGERTFNIDTQVINLPARLRLIRAVPSQIRLQVEPRATREVPVRVRYQGKPEPGYRIAREEAIPPFVRIVGPRSRVNRVEAAETDLIDLMGVVSVKEFRTNVFVDDDTVRVQTEGEVIVKINVEKLDEPGAG